MAIKFGNMGFTLTNGFVGGAVGMGNNWLQHGFATGFRKNNGVQFYAKYEAGGSILNVLAKKLIGSTANVLKDETMKELKGLAKKLLGKNIDNMAQENAMSKLIEKAEKNDEEKYGKMMVNNGNNAVVARDIYGNKCIDAIMLGIPVKDKIAYSVAANSKSDGGSETMQYQIANDPKNSFQSDTLVWYDPTALVTINSDRNLIVTKVQGRDYSRKELVSNGDINFTVTGHILSNMPEVYPATDVQKFIQIMQYKGIVKVNNLILDQFKIDGIVIKDFSLSPKEGYKSQQDYTFNAIGTMPAEEVKVTEDTINIIDNSLQQAAKEKSPWQKMLDNQLEGLTTNVLNATDQGLSLATGILDGMIGEI